MLEEWTSVAKPKLDQALVVEHIEKMVEVRGLEAEEICCKEGSVGVSPEPCPGSYCLCRV